MIFQNAYITLFFLSLFLVSCSGNQRIKMPPMPDTKILLQGASLGVGDVLEVRVYEEKNISGLYRIEADGTFTFPLVGNVKALNLTPSALAVDLKNLLKDGYLRDPQVSVFVKEFNSKKIFVLGEVSKPGTFKYEENMSIVQAITLAGGLKQLAAEERVVLTRKINEKEEKFIIPFGSIGLGKEENILLQPGDIIFVPESWL
ncbi:polysaccharide export protein [Myxococcota bacterium]|nr:polysaccharide export protein [Myxococcota bacterium]